MKKLITTSALLLAGAVMISTLGHAQSITITKRHYTGGYYVDFGGKKKAVSKIETAQPTQQNIASVETKSISTIPVANEEAAMQMPLVVVNNITVKHQKAKKHTAALNVVAKSANAEVSNNANSVSSVNADESITKVSAPETSSNAAGMPLILLVIITILLPPLGVGLAKGIGTPFWIDLILTLLFYFPGLIYGLIVILSNS